MERAFLACAVDLSEKLLDRGSEALAVGGLREGSGSTVGSNEAERGGIFLPDAKACRDVV
jgi:hypothetical protein